MMAQCRILGEKLRLPAGAPAEAKRTGDSADSFDDKDGLEALIRNFLAIILGEK
jgi:hypothetical protein